MSDFIPNVVSQCHGARVREVKEEVEVPKPPDNQMVQVGVQDVKIPVEPKIMKEIEKHGSSGGFSETMIKDVGKDHVVVEEGVYEKLPHDKTAVQTIQVCEECGQHTNAIPKRGD